MDDGRGRSSETLVSVTLPPLPHHTQGSHNNHRQQHLNQHHLHLQQHGGSGGVLVPPVPVRPGSAVRLRAPTPPPRPDSTLPATTTPTSHHSPSGRGVAGTTTPTNTSSPSGSVVTSPAPAALLSRGVVDSGEGRTAPLLFSSLSSSVRSSHRSRLTLPLHRQQQTVSGNAGGSDNLSRSPQPVAVVATTPLAGLPLLQTPPSNPSGSGSSEQNITLTSPRTVRQQNVYVDTPIKGLSNGVGGDTPHHLHHHSHQQQNQHHSHHHLHHNLVSNHPHHHNTNHHHQSQSATTPVAATITKRPPVRSAGAGNSGLLGVGKHKLSSSLPSPTTVISQPLSLGGICKKSSASTSLLIGSSPPTHSSTLGGSPLSSPPLLLSASVPAAGGAGSGGSPTDSIICGACGHCRCDACRSPRPLPSSWLCDNACLCSAEAVVDTVSCMCCVKAGLYHCGEMLTRDPDPREETWVDKPCSCTNNKWMLRWGCLAVLSVGLPCLFCYPVLKGVTRVAEKCYQSATRQGCQCRDDGVNNGGSGGSSNNNSSSSPPLLLSSPSTDSQKRLLS